MRVYIFFADWKCLRLCWVINVRQTCRFSVIAVVWSELETLIWVACPWTGQDLLHEFNMPSTKCGAKLQNEMVKLSRQTIILCVFVWLCACNCGNIMCASLQMLSAPFIRSGRVLWAARRHTVRRNPRRDEDGIECNRLKTCRAHVCVVCLPNERWI